MTSNTIFSARAQLAVLDSLQMRARRMLPAAEEIKVKYEGGRLTLIVTHGGNTVWSPFTPQDLLVAVKIVAGKLNLGITPEEAEE